MVAKKASLAPYYMDGFVLGGIAGGIISNNVEEGFLNLSELSLAVILSGGLLGAALGWLLGLIVNTTIINEYLPDSAGTFIYLKNQTILAMFLRLN